MKERLAELAKNRHADYIEIRVEEAEGSSVMLRGETFESIKEGESFGGNVRVLKNNGWGFVSFNTLDGIEDKIENAIRYAEVVGRNSDSPVRLAPVPVVKADAKAEILSDPREVKLSRKVEIVKEYGELIRSQSGRITSAVVNYFDTFSKVHFANSDGTALTQEHLYVGMACIATVAKGSVTQINSEVFSNINDFNAVLNRHDTLKAMCRTALTFVDAEVVNGGTYPVICAPLVTGLFIHEAFGHLSEGDRVSKNKELQKVMVFGRKFAEPCFSVFDSGVEKGKRGTIAYDSEGVKTEKTYLIKDGVLVGRLHSRQTAAAMGEKPTGSARAIEYKHPPIPRMRNTAVEGGKASFDDMLKGIKLGIYAKRPQGGQTGGEMFTFNTAEAYMIRDGKVCEPVRSVNLSGNVFETLKKIDMVGDDFNIAPGSCGKGPQYPLPVGYGGPSIRIQNCIVGGK